MADYSTHRSGMNPSADSGGTRKQPPRIVGILFLLVLIILFALSFSVCSGRLAPEISQLPELPESPAIPTLPEMPEELEGLFEGYDQP